MDDDHCPVCGQPYAVRCRCLRGDRTCPAGHCWHRCTVHDVIVLAASDHSKEGCSCVARETGSPAPQIPSP